MNIRPGVTLPRTIPRTHLTPEEENHSDQEGAAHNQWWGQCRQIPEHAGLLYGLSSACHSPTWHCYLSPRMAGPEGACPDGPARRPRVIPLRTSHGHYLSRPGPRAFAGRLGLRTFPGWLDASSIPAEPRIYAPAGPGPGS